MRIGKIELEIMKHFSKDWHYDDENYKDMRAKAYFDVEHWLNLIVESDFGEHPEHQKKKIRSKLAKRLNSPRVIFSKALHRLITKKLVKRSYQLNFQIDIEDFSYDLDTQFLMIYKKDEDIPPPKFKKVETIYELTKLGRVELSKRLIKP